MHETDATISVSGRVRSDCVAEWRNRSISSLIDESFSMYVSVDGDVRFGLIVVEVRDEILDRVVWEKLAELGAELRRERLVMAEDEGRLLNELDHARHRHRLAAAGNAEERLRAVTPEDALGQRVSRPRLVAGKRVGSLEFKALGH